MISEPALALTAAAHNEQSGWRKGQDVIDALPYVDTLTPEEKQAVDKLIEEEMRRATKRPADYLKDLPPIPAPTFAGDAILENEYKRLEAGEKMVGMDTKRYNLDPPPAAKRNDCNAWKLALDNAHSQLEHQYNRLLNLELLLKFGPDTWRMHNDALGVCVKQLQEQLVATRRDIESLNRERKLQQTAAGRELEKLEEEYLGLVHKNMEIEAACRQAEKEIAAVQAALEQQSGEAGPQSASNGQEGEQMQVQSSPKAAAEGVDEPAGAAHELEHGEERGPEQEISRGDTTSTRVPADTNTHEALEDPQQSVQEMQD